MKPLTPSRRRLTPGFTIVELLIVIAVIAVLAGISFAVLGSMMNTAREKATEATLAKISKLLQQQVSGFSRQYDPDSPEFKRLAGRYRMGFYALTSDIKTSEVFAKKAAYLRAFPQNRFEAAGFDRATPTADDIPLFVKWLQPPMFSGTSQQNTGGSVVSEADSVELLFLALTEGKIRGVPPVDVSAFDGSELGDTDNDGFTEFIDAWGRPLRFYRWPTRLINPLGFVANVLDNPIDNSVVQLDLVDASQFDLPPTPFHVVVGREIIEVGGVSGNSLVNLTRGALSTDPQRHAGGTIVKLAPFTEVASLLLGFINSSTMAHDADDPLGVLSELDFNDPDGFANIRDLDGSPFSSTNAQGDFELLFHTLDSYHVPLIVSAGADGELGLVEPGPTGGSGDEEPGNFWVPGSATTVDPWKWGALAQPIMPPDPSTPSGRDLSVLVNPGDSALADNITNHTAGVAN